MKKFFKEIYIYLLIILAAVLIRNFLMTHIVVEGPSMEPTLKDGYLMILNRTAYWFDEPDRFDIVVLEWDNTPVIKRVIGLPGELVEVRNQKLYINNKLVKEPFNHKTTEDFKITKRIPKGQYFFMGDNRPISYDSRYIGLTEKKDILGKTSISIYPIKKF